MFGQIDTEHDYQLILDRVEYLNELQDPSEEEISELEYLESLVSDWEEELGFE